MERQLILLLLVIGLLSLYIKKYIESFDTIRHDTILDNALTRKYQVIHNRLDTLDPYKTLDDNKKEQITQTFDKKVELMPGSIKQEIYNKEQEKQDNRILEMQREMEKLIRDKDFINKNIEHYKAIRSLTNDQPLNIVRVPKKGQHLIVVNGQCMTSDMLGDTKLSPCNLGSPHQYFQIKNINNPDAYNLQIENGPPVKDNDAHYYPFQVVKSYTNGNCLTNENGQLSVQPCNSKETQKWKRSFKKIPCTMT